MILFDPSILLFLLVFLVVGLIGGLDTIVEILVVLIVICLIFMVASYVLYKIFNVGGKPGRIFVILFVITFVIGFIIFSFNFLSNPYFYSYAEIFRMNEPVKVQNETIHKNDIVLEMKYKKRNPAIGIDDRYDIIYVYHPDINETSKIELGFLFQPNPYRSYGDCDSNVKAFRTADMDSLGHKDRLYFTLLTKWYKPYLQYID